MCISPPRSPILTGFNALVGSLNGMIFALVKLALGSALLTSCDGLSQLHKTEVDLRSASTQSTSDVERKRTGSDSKDEDSDTIDVIPSAQDNPNTADGNDSTESSLPPAEEGNEGEKVDEPSKPASQPAWQSISEGPNVEFHFAAETGGKIVVLAGLKRPMTSFPEGGYIYDPAKNSWSPIANSQALPGRASPAGAKSNNGEVLVWGGFTLNGSMQAQVGDGAVYSPASAGLVNIPAGGDSPTARFDHTMVSTGTKALVWGGAAQTINGMMTSLNYLGDGGIFDFATRTWTRMGVGGAAPQPRHGHSAVFAGNQMIVWGGRIGSGLPVNDGARYRPQFDDWVAINSNGAPSARMRHHSVWLNGKMYVWGGVDGNNVRQNSGGIYDAATDRWTSMSNINSPSSRFDDTVTAWGNSHLISFGGVNANGMSNELRAYDIATNTWLTPVITSGTPAAARASHSATALSDRIFIFGGRDNNINSMPSGAFVKPF